MNTTAHRPWSPDSWTHRLAAYEVVYPDRPAVDQAVARIRDLPPLVTSGEIERLRDLIAQAQRGERFLIQGGDCAERLADCRPDAITGKLKILLQVSLILLYASRRPVIRIGRWAGQYAKPRSSATETRVVGGKEVTLPSYYGDLVNSEEFTAAARRPDPARMVDGYIHAGLTLNFIRSLIDGGFADIHHPEYWDLSFLRRAGLPDELRGEYGRMMEGMLRWLREIESGKAAPRHSGTAGPSADFAAVEELERVEFFTSHEGLNLLYESAQTRRVPRREGWYDLTTHLPWIGERTRSLDGAHVEFFRGIRNPIGIKIGPRVAEKGGEDELVQLLDILNPANEAGKIVLIARMGAGNVRRVLPRVVELVKREGRVVLWVCDPMHGNTLNASGHMAKGQMANEEGEGKSTKFKVQSSHGADGPRPAGHRSPVTGHPSPASAIKTRSFADILAEADAAWEVCEQSGTRLGGVHIELTGDDVTECLGGASGVTQADLSRRYESACDPRLNYEQAMELAMAVGRRMGRVGEVRG